MQINVQGLETAYTDQGNRPAIVMLHGWGTNKENFAELASALNGRFRVVALDLPGFGETTMPPKDWHVSNYAAFVKSFLEVLGITDVYALIAHSFGGRVSVKGLSTGVLHAEKLVLIGSAGVGHSKSFRNKLYAGVAKTGKVIMKLPGLRGKYETARQKLHEQTGSDDYAAAGELQQIFLNTIHEDLSENIAHLRLPTLLIWGSEDVETPLADARFFHAHIAGSTLKILQGASHFVHNERPEKVARFVEEFLA